MWWELSDPHWSLTPWGREEKVQGRPGRLSDYKNTAAWPTWSPLIKVSCPRSPVLSPGSNPEPSSPALLSHWLEAARGGLRGNRAVDSTGAAMMTVSHVPHSGRSGAFSRPPPTFVDHLDFLPLGQTFL